MSYEVNPILSENKEISLELIRELQRISEVVNQLFEGYGQVLHVAPERPEEGMLVFADGTDWNPGSGAGYYERVGGAWVKL